MDVNTTPAAPSGSTAQEFCAGSSPTLSSVAVNGTNIEWYDSISGGKIFNNTTLLVNGSTWYAGQTNAGCESSARLAVKVTVNPVPCTGTDVITLKNIAEKINENDTLPFKTSDFNSAFYDSSGFALTKIRIVSLPANGVLQLSGEPVAVNEEIGAGSIDMLTFIPKYRWYGLTNFAWNGADSSNYSASSAFVNILVVPVKHPPVIIIPTIGYTIPSMGGAKTIDILTNISDIDGDTLNISIVIGPKHGNAGISATGQLVYSPDSTYSGNDTVTYEVCNDAVPPQCATGEVVFSDTGFIGSVPVPLISDITDTISENTSLQFTIKDFTSKFTDANNDTLVKILIGSLPQDGILSHNSIDVTVNQEILKANLNSLLFVPEKNFTGNTSFTWGASDGTTWSSPANIRIVVIPQNFFIPEGFSPNGDGINDYFVIQGVDQYQITLQVFNRWGDKVYESTNYQNNWDGYANTGLLINKILPNGTYFYIINLNNGEKEKVGSVTINR